MGKSPVSGILRISHKTPWKISERWRITAAEFPELREIENVLGERVEKMLDNLNAQLDLDSESDEAKRLRQEWMDYQAEVREVIRSTADVVEGHRDFDDADVTRLRDEQLSLGFKRNLDSGRWEKEGVRMNVGPVRGIFQADQSGISIPPFWQPQAHE